MKKKMNHDAVHTYTCTSAVNCQGIGLSSVRQAIIYAK